MSTLEPRREGYPILSPSRSFEGYITLRQFFNDESDYLAAFEADGALNLYDYYVESDDTKRAAILTTPLGRAVISATDILKVRGEQSLATSSVFGEKLRGFLRSEYEAAADAIRPDNDDIPIFPLENMELIRTLMRGPNGKRAAEQVRQLLLQDQDS